MYETKNSAQKTNGQAILGDADHSEDDEPLAGNTMKSEVHSGFWDLVRLLTKQAVQNFQPISHGIAKISTPSIDRDYKIHRGPEKGRIARGK